MRHNLNGLVDDAEHEENELLRLVASNAQKTQASLAVYVAEIELCTCVFFCCLLAVTVATVGHILLCSRLHRQCFEDVVA